MLSAISFAAVLASAAGSAAPTSAPPDLPATTCTLVVTGRVVDARTAEPVPNARVRVDGHAATTDDGGRWRTEGLCRTSHTIVAERADYHTRKMTIAGDREAVDVVIEPHVVERIDDVIVEAPRPATSTIGSRETLDGAELERARGRNLADTFARVPGVAVMRTGAGGLGKPIVRGQDERRSLILVDRVRHAGQKWGIDHAPEVDPFAAGSITIIKGPSAIRYGPDAIAGVMLVDPPPLPRSPGIHGRAQTIGVSNGLRGAVALSLDGAHRKAPGFVWRVEGNVTRGAALVTPRYPLDNTGSRQWNVGATLGYLRERFDLVASWRRNDMLAGLCSCLRNDSPEELEQSFQLGEPVNADLYTREYLIERPHQHTVHDLALVRSRVTVADAGELTATYSLQNNLRREYAVVRSDVTGPQLALGLRTHAVDLVFERHETPLGDRAVLRGSYGGAAMQQRNQFRSNQTLVPDYDQLQGGVFAIERVVLPRFEAEVGVRYDAMHRLAVLRERDFDAQVATGRLHASRCDEGSDGSGRCVRGLQSGSASIGALVRPVAKADTFTVALELASAGRSPTVDEHYLNGTAPSFPILGLGDARLGVERTWGSSLTLAYANEWIATDGSAFANYVDDYIYFAPEPGDGPLGFNETVQGTFQVFGFRPIGALFVGGEYGARIAPPRWPVELDGNLAIVRARDVANGRALVFVPSDRYRLALRYRWPDVWRLRNGYVGVSGSYVDRKRGVDLAADFLAPPPGYFQLGAEAGVSLPTGARTWTLAVTGTNLTNTRYREYTSLLRYFADEPGWELLVRLALDFTISGPRNRRGTT